LVQQRQELHRLIGQTLEELYADRLAEQYEVLAYHFAEGEAWAKALEYLYKAAEKAAQAFAIREAIALYDQALEAASHLGDAVDTSALMAIHQAKADLALGRLYAEARRPDHARQAYQAAREVIEWVKVNLQDPGLRASLERSPLFQPVYNPSEPS
jgi:predicted ATPase